MWEVEYTDEFEAWWQTLDASEQEAVAASVALLERLGPSLPYPHSSGIKGTRLSHLRELRTQHRGDPYRTLYAFDPRRVAILLVGGMKGGDDRWYERFIPIAERLYREHLRQLETEGPDEIARE